MTVPAEILTRLKDAAGPKGFTEDPQEIAPHLSEWRSKYHGHTPLMLKPAATEEVSRILAICNETRTPIVPQGGNTGLVGGQIPLGGEILLSLARMNRIRMVDIDGANMVAEAGATLASAQKEADTFGFLFPLSIASEGSATIGGNVSTNAGGVHVLRYGNMRDLVLGLEVVLADGRALDLMRGLRKDNSGYDLKQIFIGAEGTLGVITAAVLKLYARPAMRVTAFAAVRDPRAAIDLLGRLQEATGGMMSAFELVPRIGLEMVLAHIPQTSDPLAAHSPWYVLAEADGGAQSGIEAAMETALTTDLVTDAVIARSEAQRAALWKLRESLSEAQKLEGASIKHDVSVPIADIPRALKQGIAAASKLIPGVRPVPFGHLGDGNIHFNFSAPKGGDADAFLARWEEINRIVHDIVRHFDGSISAEHGVGVLKRAEIVRTKSPVEIALMRALKRTLDPNNILNPGKVVSLG